MVPMVVPASVSAVLSLSCGGSDFGETEIEDAYATVAGDQDVVGFEIAMDDARGVRGGQTIGDLDRDVEELPAGVDGRDG